MLVGMYFMKREKVTAFITATHRDMYHHSFLF